MRSRVFFDFHFCLIVENSNYNRPNPFSIQRLSQAVSTVWSARSSEQEKKDRKEKKKTRRRRQQDGYDSGNGSDSLDDSGGRPSKRRGVRFVGEREEEEGQSDFGMMPSGEDGNDHLQISEKGGSEDVRRQDAESSFKKDEIGEERTKKATKTKGKKKKKRKKEKKKRRMKEEDKDE